MKQAAVLLAALLIVLFGAKTAFAKFVDTSEVNASAANASAIDVKIVQRTKECSCSAGQIEETLDSVSSINEKLENLKPGDEINLSYTIVNTGCVDVILDSLIFSNDDGELGEYLLINWSITQYENDIPTNELSGDLSDLDLEKADIHLYSQKNNSCYCILKLNIIFDSNCTALSNESHQTIFKVMPTFHQQ